MPDQTSNSENHLEKSYQKFDEKKEKIAQHQSKSEIHKNAIQNKIQKSQDTVKIKIHQKKERHEKKMQNHSQKQTALKEKISDLKQIRRERKNHNAPRIEHVKTKKVAAYTRVKTVQNRFS